MPLTPNQPAKVNLEMGSYSRRHRNPETLISGDRLVSDTYAPETRRLLPPPPLPQGHQQLRATAIVLAKAVAWIVGLAVLGLILLLLPSAPHVAAPGALVWFFVIYLVFIDNPFDGRDRRR
jgi:hypothetical protein